MIMNIRDISQYIVAIIAEFAKRYQLTDKQAARYLSRYHALEMCQKHYAFMHTQSFESNIDDLSVYCKRMGGQL